MAIAVDTNVTKYGTGNGPHTWSHTISADSNFIVVTTAAHTGGSGRFVSGVTCGGVALTRAVNDSQPETEIWYLANPPTGTQTMSITYINSPNSMACTSTSLKNVDTVNPIYATYNRRQNSGMSYTINSLAGGIVIDSLYYDNTSAPTAGAGQVTIRNYQLPTNNEYSSASYKLSTSTTTSISWSGSDEHAWSIVSLKPESYGGAFLYNLI